MTIQKAKKAQEEIVGFVVIVLLVIIAMVIFLGISINNKKSSNNLESKDVYQFLNSITEYTTDCAISYEPAYLKLSELIQECNSGISICTSGKKPCSVAEETISLLINSSLIINEESSNKGYEFKSLDSSDKEILLITKGNCSGNIKSAEVLLPGFSGVISTSLKLCS